jgi:anti-sigma regulatory factor (Ser/Thr protein kinase)
MDVVVVLLHETRSLLAEACTVPVARHFVVDALRACEWDEDCVGVVALLTTELATNAVVHARTPYSITIGLTDLMVRIDVVDESGARPVLKQSMAHDGGGRGLFFLDVMADKWGIEDRPGGKSVWFELGRAPV